ncbi:MAG: ribonuclease D [Flammeovirgaceae bacterium]
MSKNKSIGNSLLDMLSEEQRKALLNASTHKQKTDEKFENQIILVENTNDLKSCSDELKKHSVLSIDLEFDDNRFTYGRNICLIQIQAENTSWIVDAVKIPRPLAIIEILNDSSYQKIFNSCQSDIGLLQELYKCYPKNIEDTSLMFKLLLESDATPSLAKLIQEKLGVVLEKDEQTSDWTKRPLSQSQIKYAANDVIYLKDLYEKLKNELENVGRWDWYLQEKKELENLTFSSSDYIEKQINKYKIHGKAMFLYKAYWKIVDELAKILNLPHYKVVSTQTLSDIAKSPPKSLEEWQKLKNLHPKLKAKEWAIKLHEATVLVDTEYPNLLNEYTLQKKLQQQISIWSDKRFAWEKEVRSYLYDNIRQALYEQKGELLQSIILSSKGKEELILSGFGVLNQWKQEIIREVCQKAEIDTNEIWHELMVMGNNVNSH